MRTVQIKTKIACFGKVLIKRTRPAVNASIHRFKTYSITKDLIYSIFLPLSLNPTEIML